MGGDCRGWQKADTAGFRLWSWLGKSVVSRDSRRIMKAGGTSLRSCTSVTESCGRAPTGNVLLPNAVIVSGGDNWIHERRGRAWGSETDFML